MPHVLRTIGTGLGNLRHVDTANSSDFRNGHFHGPPPEHESTKVLVPPQKRKIVEDYSKLGTEQASEDELREDATTGIRRSPPKKRKHCSAIRLPNLVFPKSQYQGWHPPLPISQEKDVLAEFVVHHCACGSSNVMVANSSLA